CWRNFRSRISSGSRWTGCARTRAGAGISAGRGPRIPCSIRSCSGSGRACAHASKAPGRGRRHERSRTVIEGVEHMRLCVLGPVRLETVEGRLDVGPRRVQAVLALLAAESGPASRTRLAAWLWPDAEPSAASGRLRRLLHELRERSDATLLTGDHQSVALA